jgi:hypothetical protein
MPKVELLRNVLSAAKVMINQLLENSSSGTNFKNVTMPEYPSSCSLISSPS